MVQMIAIEGGQFVTTAGFLGVIETPCGRMRQVQPRNLSKVIKDPSLFNTGGYKTGWCTCSL